MSPPRIRLDADRLSDHELAVVGATVAVVLSARGPAAATDPTDGLAAWRRAGLLEAVRHASVGPITSPPALEVARRR